MLWEIFAVGGMFFYLLLAGVFITCTVLMENDSPGMVTWMIIGLVVAVSLFSDARPLTWVAHHPGDVLVYACAYFLAGLVWSFGKWYFYCRRILLRILDIKAAFIKDQNIKGISPSDPIPEEFLDSWRNVLGKYNYSLGSIPPRASENKGKIMGWMTYWIMSLLGTMLTDVVREIWNAIYLHFSSVFQKISDRMFKNIQI